MNKINQALRLSNEENNKITKDSIQEALLYLLSKKEIDDISVTEIVNKAGVSRTAYYRNYNSKEEILKDFSSNIFQLIFSQLNNAELINNPFEWYLFIFTQVKINSRLVKLLLKAKVFSLTSFFPSISKDKYDKKNTYKIYMMESSLAIIIEKWIENDCDLSVDEISNICYELFPDITFFLKSK